MTQDIVIKTVDRVVSAFDKGKGVVEEDNPKSGADKGKEVVEEENDKSAADKGKEVDEEEIPSCNLGFTQDWEEMVSKHKKEAEKIKEAVAAVPLSFCSPMVVEKNQVSQIIRNEQQTIRTEQPVRREQTASAVTKSPFLVRNVDFSGYSADEKKVKTFLFESCPNTK